MTAFTIDRLVIPERIDSPDAADFIEMVNVRNEIEAGIMGNRDLAYEPAELLPHWRDPYKPQVCLVARVDGRIVARAIYEAPIEAGSMEVWFAIEVLPAFRRRGIGSAIFDRLHAMGVADGRTIEQSDVIHPGMNGGDLVSSPTGFGAVPRDNPETQFLLTRGFTLEQVERISRLAFPVDEALFAAALAEAQEGAGSDYRVVQWIGRTPERWLAAVALLHQRMSTDAPSAGLELTEETWDEDRVRVLDDGRDVSPRTMLVSAVEHIPSGTLAGFTELSVPAELERPVEQLDTLVVKEHRGHRLGMLLKLANLRYLEATLSGHPAVTTFNAEENRPMLAVNEQIGFEPIAYASVWKRTV